jgi:hypothetical protein
MVVSFKEKVFGDKFWEEVLIGLVYVCNSMKVYLVLFYKGIDIENS